MTEKHYVIPHSLVAGLLAYLQTRPYQEVAQAIPALMRLEEVKAKPAPDVDIGHTDSDVHMGIRA